jgi:glycosyltransferase involved in cell wall biosynthesis
VQRQVLYLLRGLQMRGADILLCCPKAGRLHQHAQELGIRTEALTIRSSMDFPSTVRLARLFSETRLDLVHAHDAASHTVARAAQGMNPDLAPDLGLVRSRYDLDDDEPVNRLQGLAGNVRWVASAARIRAHLETRGVPPQNIDVVPPAVDAVSLTALRRDAPDPWGLRQRGAVVIGTVGHLTRTRNVALLLQAFSRLRRSIERAHLLIVGAGPQTRTMQKLAATLQMQDAVTFAGAVDDLATVYATLDVFVLSSDMEISPQALLDPMAAGVPIVCTASAGVLALARHGVTSLVVPPRDAETLADSVARVLHEPELAQTIVRGGQALASQYSIERLTERILESYARLATTAGNGMES